MAGCDRSRPFVYGAQNALLDVAANGPVARTQRIGLQTVENARWILRQATADSVVDAEVPTGSVRIDGEGERFLSGF